MTKHSNLVWVVALLLGWAFDFLFWGKPLGINFAIFFTACLVGGGLVLFTNGVKPSIKSLAFLLLFAFFGVISMVRQEPMSLAFGIAGVLLSLGLLTATYQGGSWVRYRLRDYFKDFFRLLGNLVILPLGFIWQNKPDTSWVKRFPLKPVSRGVLIAIPLLIFFTLLLGSGDLVFRSRINDFLDQINLGRVPEYILRLLVIILVAYLLTAAFLYAGLKSEDRQQLSDGEQIIKRRLGFIEAAIVLGSVSLLFMIFVIIQFRYFFGGEVNIGVEGYTYSEYARSGFTQLIIVACASLLMILGLGMYTWRETIWQKWAYSGLSVWLALLVMVILVSAYQRLMLAIDWHGFSRLRVFPRVFLVWVGVLFAAIIVLEVLRRERHFALAVMLSSFGFAITICSMNVDGAIVQHNVYRTIEDKHFNVNYLTTLSTDAVPLLEAAYNDPALPQVTHEGVGAALVCYLQADWYKDYASIDWRGFNFSHWAAINALNRIGPHLQDYKVITNMRGYVWENYAVETPSHDRSYACDQVFFKELPPLPTTSGSP
ncbi:MAG: DUF4173 domain-containing protein [Anaerolineales bacterium]